DRRGHGHRRPHGRRGGDRVVIVVPAVVAAIVVAAHVDVALDVDVVDVVDAGASDIVGACVGPAVVDLRILPASAARLTAGTLAAASGARTATTTTATA